MEKEDLFAKFFSDWEEQLFSLANRLQELQPYREHIDKLDIGNLLTPNDLFANQKEWVWLVSKYTGIEASFFKPYWAPLQSDKLGPFVDLSNPNFPIVDAEFFQLEPYRWDTIQLFSGISELLNACENSIDTDHFKEELKNKKVKLFESVAETTGHAQISELTEELRLERSKHLSFLDNTYMKEHYINQVKEVISRGMLNQGVYWLNGQQKEGISLTPSLHSKYESALGIPEMIAKIEDKIFIGLPSPEYKDFPLQFISAIPVGVDLTITWKRIMIWLLDDDVWGVKNLVRENQLASIEVITKFVKRSLIEEIDREKLNDESNLLVNRSTKDANLLFANAGVETAYNVGIAISAYKKGQSTYSSTNFTKHALFSHEYAHQYNYNVINNKPLGLSRHDGIMQMALTALKAPQRYAQDENSVRTAVSRALRDELLRCLRTNE